MTNGRSPQEVADWLREVADEWQRDRELHGSPAVRESIDEACEVFRMAANDLAPLNQPQTSPEAGGTSSKGRRS